MSAVQAMQGGQECSSGKHLFDLSPSERHASRQRLRFCSWRGRTFITVNVVLIGSDSRGSALIWYCPFHAQIGGSCPETDLLNYRKPEQSSPWRRTHHRGQGVVASSPPLKRLSA